MIEWIQATCIAFGIVLLALAVFIVIVSVVALGPKVVVPLAIVYAFAMFVMYVKNELL